MENTEMKKIIDRQRAFFHTGTTLDVSFRIAALKRLQYMIRRHEKEIEAALLLDLKKSSFESYMCETGLVLDEIHYMLRHIRSFAKEQDVRTPLAQFCSRSYRKPSPYGVTLIVSPWNYPILLTLDPLIDAIAAGNTVILKPSAYSPACSDLLAKLIHRYFPAKYLTVITGGRSENTALLQQHFDYIFFTGSKTVGREVMRQASSHLTPVTLELGGKSPCLVDESADLALAARRIVFGKFLNCGQTCVAPDYVYCDEKRKEALICELKRQITKQFGSEPLKNPSYGKIINQKHFERIRRLLNPEKVIFGGNVNPDTLQIAPTLLDHVTFEGAIMQEEIFGPVAVIMKFKTEEEVIAMANDSEYGLGGAVWTRDINRALRVARGIETGRMWVNTYNQIPAGAPFGGYKRSGIGRETDLSILEHYTQKKNIMINLNETPSGFYPEK